MSEWNTVKLGDVIDFIDGDRGKNYPNGDDFSVSGFCLFLNTGNVTKEGFNFDSTMFITDEKDKCLRKGKLCLNDVVLTTRGTVGNTAYLSKMIPYKNIRINSGMLIARSKGHLLPKYIYYLFKSEFMQKKFIMFRSGSAQPQLPVKDLTCITVPVPNITTQRAIVNFISSYDNLIDNNNRRIAILEEMAQRIYREWFVHFRFTGHENIEMVESELGMIPVGWKISELGNYCSVLRRGISPKYNDYAVGMAINQKCIRDFSINLQLARHQEKAFPTELQVQIGDVLINSTGVGTLGRVAQMYEFVPNCTVDSHVTLLRPEKSMMYYIGSYFREKQDTIMDMGVGSTGQTELNRDKIRELCVIVPDHAIVCKYEKNVGNFMALKIQLQNKNITLRKTRDLLLPRLISGDIDVSKIDIPMEDVNK